MADAREFAVWTNHAVEQWEENKVGHEFSDNSIYRRWLLELKDVTKVLDLGCGGALWRKLFKGFNYTGADQNENMLVYAKKRFPDDRFVLTNGMNLVFGPGSFDLVFTSAVLQHNRHEDKNKVVAEIVRILRPGGYYMCTENTFRHDNYSCTFKNTGWHESLDDGYSFTKEGWEKYMSSFGLKLMKFDLPSEYLYIKE